MSKYVIIVKPALDLLISIIVLFLLSWVIITLIIVLFMTNKGQPFYFQLRSGKNRETFKLIKFKTMNNNCDEEGNLLNDFERFTRVGKLLRKTSLDELPQLINVLKGDMSLIGPRPLLPEYLPLYNKRQKRRHEVRPGITGWAQVNGRNSISWEQKFEYDVWYVENVSFALDVKIIWLTLLKIIKSEGIDQDKDVTMEKFSGSKK